MVHICIPCLCVCKETTSHVVRANIVDLLTHLQIPHPECFFFQHSGWRTMPSKAFRTFRTCGISVLCEYRPLSFCLNYKQKIFIHTSPSSSLSVSNVFMKCPYLIEVFKCYISLLIFFSFCFAGSSKTIASLGSVVWIFSQNCTL